METSELIEIPQHICFEIIKSYLLSLSLSYSRYHGAITREETAILLGKEDGNYLVRKGLSQSGTYSLSFV